MYRAKTSTERVRAFRAKHHAGRPPKPPPKSPAQRAREFRQRQKIIKAAAAAVLAKAPLQQLELVTIDDEPVTKPEATTSNSASAAVTSDSLSTEQPQTNTNVEVCKKKWRNIRDSYKKYTREVQIDLDAKKVKRYKYADLLNFINPSMQRGYTFAKKYCSQLENQEEHVEDTTSEDQNESYCDNEDTNDSTEINVQEDEIIDDDLETIKNKLAALLNESEDKIKKILQHDENRQRQRKDDDKNDEERRAKKRRKVDADDDDENDTLKQLFLSMYGTVKSFPPTLQAETKIKLFNIIASAELEYLKQKDTAESNSTLVTLHPMPTNTPPVIVHCDTEEPLLTICKTETLFDM